MKITLAAIVPRRSRAKADAIDTLIADFLKRSTRFNPIDSQLFDTEPELLAFLAAQPGRTAPVAILLDSRGQQLSSEDFAQTLARHRDQGTQRLILAIGPADGWSKEAHTRANLLFSLGRITLPHQLARLVLAEQTYRALTILANHPYHSGH